eukprot:754454-Hanusia_phi.AAC.1
MAMVMATSREGRSLTHGSPSSLSPPSSLPPPRSLAGSAIVCSSGKVCMHALRGGHGKEAEAPSRTIRWDDAMMCEFDKQLEDCGANHVVIEEPDTPYPGLSPSPRCLSFEPFPPAPRSSVLAYRQHADRLKRRAQTQMLAAMKTTCCSFLT